MGDASLASLLGGLKLGSSDINSIVKDKQDGHYQLACQKYFDVTHPGHQSMSIGDGAYSNHPNQFFNASISYHKVKNGGSATAAAPGGGSSSSQASDGVESASQVSQPLQSPDEKMEIA
jgi:DNA primase large subunit